MSFSPVYLRRVLDPSFANWKRLFAEEALSVHRAHLVMLFERGVIARETARAIRGGIEALVESFRPPSKLPDGVEDLYFLFERELGGLIGAESAGYLHTARSRNDMDTTIFRLVLKRALSEFLTVVTGCCRTILRRAREGTSAPIVLYTHGQPANVSTLAHYLTAFLLELLESAERLLAAIEVVDRSTMGACAITTTGFSIDRERVSSLLGFRRPVLNSYQAISTAHWLTFAASACSSLMSDVTRLAADLSHKASSEVGILVFPDELVQVSSIMPQKRNPVIIEHIRIQAGLARGEFAGIEELFHNVPFQDVNEVADAPVERLLAALEMAGSCFELVSETVGSVDVDSNRVRAIALDFGTTTSELADSLVRDFEMGFRQAHGIVQDYVRSGYDKEALRASFLEARGSALSYSDERIEELLSPEEFIAVRRVPGGPAPEGMEPVLREAEERIEALGRALEELNDRRAQAAAALASAYEGIGAVGRRVRRDKES